jgi:hypothetical protein
MASLDRKTFAQAKSTADPLVTAGEKQRKRAEHSLVKTLGRAPKLEEVRRYLRTQLQS